MPTPITYFLDVAEKKLRRKQDEMYRRRDKIYISYVAVNGFNVPFEVWRFIGYCSLLVFYLIFAVTTYFVFILSGGLPVGVITTAAYTLLMYLLSERFYVWFLRHSLNVETNDAFYAAKRVGENSKQTR